MEIWSKRFSALLLSTGIRPNITSINLELLYTVDAPAPLLRHHRERLRIGPILHVRLSGKWVEKAGEGKCSQLFVQS
jgi:hypothetical protein